MAKKPIKIKENADTRERIRSVRRKSEEFSGSGLPFFESVEISDKMRE